ncbi:hypothetical protein IG631_18007 [Alternaria alternata]|nr:hypothetical protein IG631_18007 [Alternaria alternata]
MAKDAASKPLAALAFQIAAGSKSNPRLYRYYSGICSMRWPCVLLLSLPALLCAA